MSCDGRIGVAIQEDQCRICGGRNTTCTLHKGVFHTPLVVDRHYTLASGDVTKISEQMNVHQTSANNKIFDNIGNKFHSSKEFIVNGSRQKGSQPRTKFADYEFPGFDFGREKLAADEPASTQPPIINKKGNDI